MYVQNLLLNSFGQIVLHRIIAKNVFHFRTVYIIILESF